MASGPLRNRSGNGRSDRTAGLLNDLGEGRTADRGLDGGIDISRCESIASSLGAVDPDEQAGLAADAKDADVRDTIYGLHHLCDLVARRDSVSNRRQTA